MATVIKRAWLMRGSTPTHGKAHRSHDCCIPCYKVITAMTHWFLDLWWDIVSGWKHYARLFWVTVFLHLCSVVFYCLAIWLHFYLQSWFLPLPTTALLFLSLFWALCSPLYQIKKKGILSTDLFFQSFPPRAFSCYPIRIPIRLRQNTAPNTFSCPGPLTSRQTVRHAWVHTQKEKEEETKTQGQSHCYEKTP